jgi:hypothetical protein
MGGGVGTIQQPGAQRRRASAWHHPKRTRQYRSDVTLVLDAGGLIAVDRRDRSVGAILRVAQQEGVAVRTSAAVVAQVWRNGSLQANLARVLAGVDSAPLDGPTGRMVGEVLAHSRTADVLGGHLGLITQSEDTVLTSDPVDIKRILRSRGVRATVHKV